MLGRYLDEKIPEFIYKYKHLLFFIACISIIALSLIALNYTSVVLGYSSPITAFMVIVIFCCIKGHDFRKKELLWNMDRLCFALYLCHPVFTNLVYKLFRITPLMFDDFIIAGIFVFWAFFVICGFMSARVIHMIPPLRKIVM